MSKGRKKRRWCKKSGSTQGVAVPDLDLDKYLVAARMSVESKAWISCIRPKRHSTNHFTHDKSGFINPEISMTMSWKQHLFQHQMISWIISNEFVQLQWQYHLKPAMSTKYSGYSSYLTTAMSQNKMPRKSILMSRTISCASSEHTSMCWWKSDHKVTTLHWQPFNIGVSRITHPSTACSPHSPFTTPKNR